MKRLRWHDHLALNLFWLGLNIRNTALGAIFMLYLVGLFVPEATKNSALGGRRAAAPAARPQGHRPACAAGRSNWDTSVSALESILRLRDEEQVSAQDGAAI
ncbi:MAG: hypothetical protein JETCAE02_08470 [Anaerolineaceae bacterium]|nr:hypothetical protein [Anaerolineae bacterium]MBL1172647.1 hypothetical protein [Chloroflexota bacterium]WKZ54770.1 MAG: hypothetical protein QY324_01835 [Anaerolineales bacterium]GJQ38435.1 MAG: hypothetical protein JETCAE02_08470 [Anaerolineaceae bacterium]NOG76138.1 hypothetical protein [Chloroflexota bacterium]